MSAARDARRARFGPLEGDRIRLADTDLWVRVGEDRQAAGDEPYWGYAKDLRARMVQGGSAGPSELDVVITGAVVIDPAVGVVKADIGIKDGRTWASVGPATVIPARASTCPSGRTPSRSRRTA